MEKKKKLNKLNWLELDLQTHLFIVLVHTNLTHQPNIIKHNPMHLTRTHKKCHAGIPKSLKSIHFDKRQFNFNTLITPSQTPNFPTYQDF